MTEINYYLHNWGRICLWLALYCLVEAIFGSIAFIPKTILFAILLTNNRKFLYLLNERDNSFKDYYRFLKTSCILFGIGGFIVLVGGVIFNVPIYYYYYYLGYYGYSYWQSWLYVNADAINLVRIIVENSIALTGVIFESCAWVKLKSIFKRNLLDAQPYYQDNLKRAIKLMIWGVVLFGVVILANLTHRSIYLLFGERYYIYQPVWDAEMYSYYTYDISYTIISWIVRGVELVASILLGVGYLILGSSLKNPFFSSKNPGIGYPPRLYPKYVPEFVLENKNITEPNNKRNFCPKCGTKLRPEGRFCPVCGTDILNFPN